jgi:hypothetical protein
MLLSIAIVLLAYAPLAQAQIEHCTPNVVSYDLVYVRASRYGDSQNTSWPDTTRPIHPDPGADLRLLHPDCTEEVLFPTTAHQALVDAPLSNGAVADPNVSFDGKWVVFVYYHDQRALNPQRQLSLKGADIYRLHLETREVVRLTRQVFTPNTGYTNDVKLGVFNIGPAFVAQNTLAQPAIVFTSTRNGFLPPRPFGYQGHALQLFLMNWNGQNVEQIGYLNQTRALHPFQLLDGRLMFTSWENQGVRDRRLFNLWFIAPDGTQWSSGSGLGEIEIGHHFMTQMANGDIVVVRYYNLNNNGFGGLARFPVDPPGPDFLPINQPGTYMPLQRPGQVDLTDWVAQKWALAQDFPAPCTIGGTFTLQPCAGGNSTRTGKVTHPAVAPGDDLLLVYTPGAANHNGIYVSKGLATPFYDGGLYLMTSDFAASGKAKPTDLKRIVNNPAYSEQWPRPVVPFSRLFPGKSQPPVWPALKNTGQPDHALSAHTPFGLVGTSSLIWRDTDGRKPGAQDSDPFNQSHAALSNWIKQGADAGVYSEHDIYAIRLLALLPSTDRRYPNNRPRFANYAEERIRILGEIPVRHEGVTDANGNTDTSFLARLPAEVPFTFQTLDRNGMVLNMAQTWHQVRPGEARYDCGGCHAHSKAPLDFHTTVAGQEGFQPTDLALQTLLLTVTALNGTPTTTIQPTTNVTVEYNRDVKPILEQRCAGCHFDDTSDGKLNLHADTTALTCEGTTWPGTYYRLVRDRNSNACPKFGLGPPAGTPGSFFEPQMTRYIRAFQSRQSLLIWKVFGARLDGRQNDTRSGDIDYDSAADAIHPNLPTSHGLTWDEKLTLARWVDLGAPIDFGSPGGWFEDDLRPTLWVSPTVDEAWRGSVSKIIISAYDLESGLAANTLSVTFNIPIGQSPAGTNLAAGLSPTNGGVLDVPLLSPVDLVASRAVLTVTIKDNAGHLTEIRRAFSTD